MDSEEIRNASEDPDLIPGIYNYCDRWCERCYLSSRCLNFKMEMREKDRRESNDTENKEFWKELQASFSITSSMLQNLADELGMDIHQEDLEDLKGNIHKPENPDVMNHPVNLAAEIYFESSRKWIDANYEVFQKKPSQDRDLINSINQTDNDNKYLLLNDLYEIINWYHTMILVKSKRAVMSSMDDGGKDDIHSEMNGTAKVVLNCIDRSSFAWNGIMKNMPQQESVALKNLANLQLLEENIHRSFPKAENFIRPGFDENIG